MVVDRIKKTSKGIYALQQGPGTGVTRLYNPNNLQTHSISVKGNQAVIRYAIMTERIIYVAKNSIEHRVHRAILQNAASAQKTKRPSGISIFRRLWQKLQPDPKKILPTRVCKYDKCEKEFPLIDPRQLYCGSKCRNRRSQRDHRLRHKAIGGTREALSGRALAFLSDATKPGTTS